MHLRDVLRAAVGRTTTTEWQRLAREAGCSVATLTNFATGSQPTGLGHDRVLAAVRAAGVRVYAVLPDAGLVELTPDPARLNIDRSGLGRHVAASLAVAGAAGEGSKVVAGVAPSKRGRVNRPAGVGRGQVLGGWAASSKVRPHGAALWSMERAAQERAKRAAAAAAAQATPEGAAEASAASSEAGVPGGASGPGPEPGAGGVAGVMRAAPVVRAPRRAGEGGEGSAAQGGS